VATPPAATAVPGHRFSSSLGNGPGHRVGEGNAILAIVLDELGGQDEAVPSSVAHFDGVGVLDARDALGPIVGASGGGVQGCGGGSHRVLHSRRLGDALKKIKKLFKILVMVNHTLLYGKHTI